MTVTVDTGPTERIVVDKFESSQAFATDLWNIAKDYLNELNTGAYSFSMGSPSTEVSPIDMSNIENPADPPAQDLSLELPDFPDIQPLDTIAIDQVTVPSLDTLKPDIDYPDPVDKPFPDDLEEPPEITQPELPTPPEYTLPDPPTIEDLTIPPIPPLTMPSFEGTLPIDNIDPPSSIFEYSEAMYESALKDAVENKLLDLVTDGGTGLAVDVEAALWARARARLELEKERKYEDVENHFAARGFNIPQGALSSALADVIKENDRADQQINYEVMIEQARLAQTNTHFAITSVIQHEANVMVYITNRNNRMLDVAKYVQESAIAIFNARVAHYAKQLTAYQASAAVYESRIRAEGLIMENYKVQLEGVRLTNDIQRQEIELYSLQLEGVKALVSLYNAQLETVRLQADVERLKLEEYREKVNVYTARINGVVSCYNVYQAQIAGEAAKASVYSEQVRAYIGEVEAIKIEADINIAEANVKVEKNKSLLEEFKTRILKANTILASRVAAVEAKGRIYGYDVDKYKADISRALTEISAEIDRYGAESSHVSDVAKVSLSSTELFFKEVDIQHQMDFEKIRTGATIAAQMAASALSAVAAGAQLSVRAGLSGEVGEYYNHNLGV